MRDALRWWTYSPDWGAVSNVGAEGEAAEAGVGGGELWSWLLDPAPLIPLLDFEPGDAAELLGRPALRVDATPRGREPWFSFHQLPLGADRYELLVDRERGAVLRAAAVLEGEEFWVSELEQLAFDERFPDGIFVFEPPPGEEVRAPDLHLHEPVTIEEAARRASFPVFALPELPEGRWQLHVAYVQARERPRMQESVHLAYHRADAAHALMVTEQPAGEGPPEWAAHAPGADDVEEVERDGRRLRVYRPSRGWAMPLTILLEERGTAIQLSSSDLDEGALLSLAASMEPLAP